MRECLVCGGTRENGGEKVIFDYCESCLKKDVEILRRIHMKIDKKKGPSDPGKDTGEAR